MDLSNSTALITGGNRGIGLAIARLLPWLLRLAPGVARRIMRNG